MLQDTRRTRKVQSRRHKSCAITVSYDKPISPHFADLVDLICNKLTVVRFDHVRRYTKGTKSYWYCRCECGNCCLTQGSSLRAGRAIGCKQCFDRERRFRKHGLHGTAAYRIWSGMMHRCYTKNSKDYRNYGGRGIKVCRRWHDVKNFVEDMGQPPTGATIERENNDSNYKPSNCVWAARSVQSRNRRGIRLITVAGITKCLTDWLAAAGVSYTTFRNRLSAGMSEQVAATTPRYGATRI